MNITMILIVLIILVFLFLRVSTRQPSTANDYYVAYNIDDNDKSVIIWFIPIVSINLWRGEASAITSNDKYVERIIHHPEKGDGFHAYGHWIRNNQVINGNGIPEDDSFSGHLLYFVSKGYRFTFANTVPDEYSKAIGKILEQANDA